jgi:hypothetical protein
MGELATCAVSKRRVAKKNNMLTQAKRRIRRLLAGSANPPFGTVRFGDLRRVTPISRVFGFDRGKPVDRYYIENFLARHASDVHGRVIEIGDNNYTKQFGGDRVTKSDVLHVAEGNPLATIVDDITEGKKVASDTYDCFIFTQTLQLVYDCRAAIRTIYRVLKPGGVVLATVSGNTRNTGEEFGQGWYWNFTDRSAQRLFEEVFSAERVETRSYGNVLASTAFLHGISAPELRPEELEHNDRCYPVVITVRAVKPGRAGA